MKLGLVQGYPGLQTILLVKNLVFHFVRQPIGLRTLMYYSSHLQQCYLKASLRILYFVPVISFCILVLTINCFNYLQVSISWKLLLYFASKHLNEYSIYVIDIIYYVFCIFLGQFSNLYYFRKVSCNPDYQKNFQKLFTVFLLFDISIVA